MRSLAKPLHVRELRVRLDCVERSAVFALPAGIDVHVTVSVIGKPARHQGVRRLFHPLLRDLAAEGVPAREPHERGKEPGVRRDDEPDSPFVGALRVFGPYDGEELGIFRDRAGNDAVLEGKPVGKPGNGYGERPFSGNGYAVEDRLSRRRAEYRRRVYGRFPGKWDRVCDLHGLPPSNGVSAPPWTRQGWRDDAEFYHGPGKMTREMCGNRGRLQTRRAISRDEARRYRVDYRPVDAWGAGAP